jgi:hypothetical protein
MSNIFAGFRDWLNGLIKKNMLRIPIPGIMFRREVGFRILLKTSRENYSLFNKITSIDGATKELIRPIARHCIADATNSIVGNWMKGLKNLGNLSVIFLLVIISGAIIGPWVYFTISTTKNLSFGEWGVFIILHIFFFVIGLWFLLLPYYRPRWMRKLILLKATTWGLMATIVYIIILFCVSIFKINFLLSSSIISGFTGVLIVAIPTFFIILFAQSVISKNFPENTNDATCDSGMVYELIRMLSTAEMNEKHWSNINFKNNIMLGLERIAIMSEHELPLALTAHDGATNYWFAKTAKEIGAGFRNLKKWILTPKDNTRELFINHIKNDLISAINGSWDNFEKCPPETIQIQQLGGGKIKSILGDVFSGILPLGLVWLLKYLGFEFNGIGFDYLITAAVGWTILSILSIFNPSINDIKTNALKNVISRLFEVKTES